MPCVKVRDRESFDVTLRRFRRECDRSGRLVEVHRREFHETSAEERKRKSAAARRRKRDYNKMRGRNRFSF